MIERLLKPLGGNGNSIGRKHAKYVHFAHGEAYLLDMLFHR